MAKPNTTTTAPAKDTTPDVTRQVFDWGNYISRPLPATTAADVKGWINAVDVAQYPDQPYRLPLLGLQNRQAQDGTIRSAMLSRKRLALEKAPMLLRNGLVDVRGSKRFAQPWFKSFCKLALDARFYGFSLIQIKPTRNDGIRAELVPREIVCPIRKWITAQPGQQAPVFNYEEQYWLDNLIEVIDEETPLGLLALTGKEYIIRKNAVANWADWVEIFAQPIRALNVQSLDDPNLDKKEQLLQKMGASACIVLEKSDDLKLLETSKTDAHKVYQLLAELCLGVMERVILGLVGYTNATMTYSNLSQRIALDVVNDDRTFLEDVINHKLLPLMRGFEGCQVVWPREFNPEALKALMELYTAAKPLGFSPDPSKFPDTFGLHLIHTPQLNPPPVS